MYVMKEIKINIKSVSGKKSRITTRTMLFDENINVVEELIKAAVAATVNEYNERRESSDLITVLTPGLIEDKAQTGKVSFGVNYGEKSPDLETAVNNALEAFADGIVVIFADDKKLDSLDEAIDINEIKSLTFVKLTMLAGRMW
ncbi:MAG: hypothetical protein IIZ46_04885 [Clostridia bacterium]|nr:hypothetical protein [Clostridia bacterium]